MKRSIPLLTMLMILSLTSTAFASTITGADNGHKLAFVQPIQTFANGLESIGAAVVIICIIVMVISHMMHHEDIGGIMRILIVAIIGGAVVLTAGSFMSQVGITTGAVI